MTRTFIAALVGATALGVVSANAAFVDKSDIRMFVEDNVASFSLSQNEINDIYVVTDLEGSGERIDGFSAYIDLKEGGTKVVVFDANGTVERSYNR